MSIFHRAVGRRPLLVLTAAAPAVSVLSSCGSDGAPALRTDVPFRTELPIPPLAESEAAADGRLLFRIAAQEGRHSFLPGTETTTWGYDGAILGPTLRAARGDDVSVEVTNDLPETTSVHWHGMHVPAHADGGPHQPIEPGATWEARWTVDQPAATLWYHPHPHGDTEAHVHRGLAGFFILDDPDATAVGLPDEYGVDDLPIAVQDKRVDDDGELAFDAHDNAVGVVGNLITANGVAGAYHDVTTETVRLRLLNGTQGRVLNLGFDDDRGFAQVASDGGLLPEPVTMDRVQLSPGERAEVVVRFEPGDQVRLRTFAADLEGVTSPAFFGADDEADVLELRAAAELAPSPEPGRRLADIAPLSAEDATRTRRFTLDGRQINGAPMDMDRIDEVVEVDSTEIWEVRNISTFPHNFHVHDVQFQVLDIDGAQPPAHLRGWKDTVYLPPGRRFRLVMRFEDYADPAMPYMYHCHWLVHEDQGMMGQFVVVEPGQSAGDIDSEGHDHG